MLGLPDPIRACLFDMDGVLTQTATVHAAAWKEMFDAFLLDRSRRTGTPFVPFDAIVDYDEYVDGRPRTDGTRAFLQSRGISLPEGSADDAPDGETVQALSTRKNDIVQRLIRRDGVHVYPGSLQYLQATRAAGLRRAVVTSSANAREVLEAAGLAGMFDARVDGLDIVREHLSGKPAPDTFLAAADALAVSPHQSAVFEDALAGVAAGRAGNFGFVVGVDRAGQAAQLQAHGADLVVSDLAELLSQP